MPPTTPQPLQPNQTPPPTMPSVDGLMGQMPTQQSPMVPAQNPQAAPVPPPPQAPPPANPQPADVATAQPVQPEVDAASQVHEMQVTTQGSTKLAIEPFLEEVIRRDASDLHVQVGLPPMVRVDGALAPIRGQAVLSAENIDDILFGLLDDEQKEVYLKDKEIDFSFAYGELGRFRVNAFHEKGNPAVAFRLIPNKIRTVEDLQLPPIMNKLTEFPRGLVLVTGPTGSGKSTTLAAMLDKVNRERAMHIITIEDPIEYQHHHKKSIVVQREVHFDTRSFSSALRSSLREDPDVVLIGEMRDLETISTAITVAETGHLVFATLHTNSAAQSIDRMVDVFPPHQQQQIRIQLASVLQGIVAQRLIPMVGGGRMAVAEILVVTPAVRNIIREGKTHQLDAVIQTGAEYGMQSMDATLARNIHEGKITYEEAKNYAVNLEELDRLMRG